MIALPGDRVGVIPIFDPDAHDVPNTNLKIWIPDSAKDRCDQGIVKYVGAGVKNVQIGDYVIFSGYTGTLLQLEGEGKLLIMREKFIIAKIIEGVDLSIPGLYHRGRNGEFFTATYESVFEFIAAAITPKRVKSEKPRQEDYEDEL